MPILRNISVDEPMPSYPHEVAIAEMDQAGQLTGRLWCSSAPVKLDSGTILYTRWCDLEDGHHGTYRRMSSYKRQKQLLEAHGRKCVLVVWIHPDYQDKPLLRYQKMGNRFPGSPRR